MKDFLTKEGILRAARNKQRITLDEHVVQIYPDISPATLDRHRGLKEITTALQSAHIRYRWGFPFKLVVPHNGTTYSATTLLEGQDILVKLGLLDAEVIHCPPSTPRPSPIWCTPPPRCDRKRIHYDIGEALTNSIHLFASPLVQTTMLFHMYLFFSLQILEFIPWSRCMTSPPSRHLT